MQANPPFNAARIARQPATVALPPGNTHAAKLPDDADRQPVIVVPLDRETRSAIPTAEAARHLGRQPQTLRCWAMTGAGPIKAIRVHGRLAWPVAEIRTLLGVAG